MDNYEEIIISYPVWYFSSILPTTLLYRHLKRFSDTAVGKCKYDIVLWKSRTQNSVYVIVVLSSGHLWCAQQLEEKWAKIYASAHGEGSMNVYAGEILPWQLGGAVSPNTAKVESQTWGRGRVAGQAGINPGHMPPEEPLGRQMRGRVKDFLSQRTGDSRDGQGTCM